LAAQSSAATWEQVFQNPRPISVESFETGRIDVQRSQILDLTSSRAQGLTDGKVTLPVLAHLLHHERLGNYLVDVGLDRSWVRNPNGTIKGLLAKKALGGGMQMAGTDIATLVERRKLSLGGVFLTHLHFDHIAGARDLPGSLAYVAGKDEPYQNYRWLFHGDQLNHIAELREIDFSKAPPLPPFEHAVDVFGDGSFWALSTSGHSQGHVSFLVNGPSGPVFLAGDAAIEREGFERGVGCGTFALDRGRAQKTLETIIAFSRQFPSVRMIFGHAL
jgi:glyoxylase-like metal-dependent hydrolase (beta-lactamase superfamily II)